MILKMKLSNSKNKNKIKCINNWLNRKKNFNFQVNKINLKECPASK